MKHAVVVDLGLGDAGKGSLTDFLCETRGYHTVVRYNGGSQAGHRVVRADGREHVFHQFGSGTFAGAITILSKYVYVNPLLIAREADELEALGIDRPLSRIAVDWDALVTTPLHASTNRLEETARGESRHGSCGHGIGKTREYANKYPFDALRVRDLADPEMTNGKLELLAERLGQPVRTNGMRELAAAYKRFTNSAVSIINSDGLNLILQSEPVVFEGAQGVLLDEKWGFPPYYTWSDTTASNALDLLLSAGVERTDATVLGLTRSYMTRHGPGPFPTESAGMTARLPDAANGFNQWQREWRVGHLDLPLIAYALTACENEIDELVVSCLDRLETDRVCRYYEDESRLTKFGTEFLNSAVPVYGERRPIVETLEQALELPVTIASHGPSATDKTERAVVSP